MRRYYYNPVDNPNDRLEEPTLSTTAETAAVAELAYTAADGNPRIESLTPLPLDGSPAFALPYSRTELARDLERSPQVSLTFSDSRRAYVGWTPLAVRGRVEITPDSEGELFDEKLLHWELRKYPPSRGLISSLLLRRDNWWYVPRLIVRYTPTEDPRPAARRTGDESGVLAYEDGASVSSTTVRVNDWDAEKVAVYQTSPEVTLPEGLPAALLYHDFSMPDRELSASLLLTGRLENGRLSVESRTGTRDLGKLPSLIARWRAQKDLERRCKAGLKSRGEY